MTLQCVYSDQFVLPLPKEHRFPMKKYALLHQTLRTEKFLPDTAFVSARTATIEELRGAHCPTYISRVQNGTLSPLEVRRIGFPWSPELFVRSCHVSGATIQACEAALIHGCAVNLAGGTHHASFDRGQGYCVFNDCAVAARALQDNHGLGQVLILDCDVHQGNGTAAIFADDESVFTCSIHNEKAFPVQKFPSDLDVGLAPGTKNTMYLNALETLLRQAFAQSKPELVLYLAGVDPYEGDTLGGFRLSQEGLAARDQLVLSFCRSLGIPIAIVMSGGYAKDPQVIASLHTQTIRIAFSHM